MAQGVYSVRGVVTNNAGRFLRRTFIPFTFRKSFKKRESPPATEYGELNIHKGGGDFRFILKQEQPEDNKNTPQPDLMFPRVENIRELNREVIHTDLQAAGAYIAEALGDLTLWYDLRFKVICGQPLNTCEGRSVTCFFCFRALS